MTSSPLENLATQKAELLRLIASLSTLDALREAEVGITGKRSILSVLQKSLGSLAPEERAAGGALLQEARREVEEALGLKRDELSRVARAASLEADRMDLGDVVVLDSCEMPHQPGDRVGLTVRTKGQFVRRGAVEHFFDDLADPSECVTQQIGACHVGSSLCPLATTFDDRKPSVGFSPGRLEGGGSSGGEEGPAAGPGAEVLT